MQTQIDRRLTWHSLTVTALLAAMMTLSFCKKGGGGGGGGWEDKTRSALRAERSRSSSSDYANKWGLPKK